MKVLNWAEECAVTALVREEALKRGVTATPTLVEHAANAVRGGASVTAAELRERAERLLENAERDGDRPQGRECLTPDGHVVRRVRGPELRAAELFAVPKPYWLVRNGGYVENDQQQEGHPAAEDDLAKAQVRLRELEAIIADPATDSASRISAKIERSQMLEIIESTAAARRIRDRLGAARTSHVQQWARPTPYFRLSDAKRAEYEAEAAALRVRIAAPGLDLITRDKLKQDLAKVEHLLAMDKLPTPDMRPIEALRFENN